MNLERISKMGRFTENSSFSKQRLRRALSNDRENRVTFSWTAVVAVTILCLTWFPKINKLVIKTGASPIWYYRVE